MPGGQTAVLLNYAHDSGKKSAHQDMLSKFALTLYDVSVRTVHRDRDRDRERERERTLQ